MKAILFTVIFIIITGFSAMGQDIQQIIDEVRIKFAPDKRTSIFDVSFSVDNENLLLKGEVSDLNFKEKLIERLRSTTDLKIIDSIETLPSKKVGKKIYGIVNLSVCNIRSKPEHPAELSTQALMGTPIKIYKEHSGWYLIQTPDEYLGWVDEDGIALKTSEEMKDWTKSSKLIFTNHFGFIYSDKNFTTVLSDVVAGNIFEKIGQSKKYYEIRLPDGRKGFVKIEEAQELNSWLSRLSYNPEKVIEFAKNMMGFPYLWGGTSVKGFDCSGYMKTIFFMNGLILPRDANQQALVGDEVELDEEFSKVKAGDLIFFGRRGNEMRPERITHVGIYIGDKKFLHSSGRVRLDSFDKNDENYNEYRLHTIVRIKRIFSNQEILDQLKITNNKFYSSEFYK